MLAFNRRTKIFISKDPGDMRASYDSLFQKAKSLLGQDPFSGHFFVFMNKRRTSMKCLYFDGTGFVIVAKRLERGCFSNINPYYPGPITLTQAEFSLLFEGAQINKRFIESPPEVRKSTYEVRDSKELNFP